METKNPKALNEQELEKVSGGEGTKASDQNCGPASQWGEDAKFLTKVCPKCISRFHSMNAFVQFGRVEDGTLRKVVSCRVCGHSFYVNDDGELISLGSGG